MSNPSTVEHTHPKAAATAQGRPSIGWLLALCMLALAPVNTKVGGTLWLVLVVGALVVWWRQRSASGVAGTDASARVAWVWLGFCVAGSLFKLAGVLYWDDPVGTRHFEIRLTLAAVASWLLVRYLPPQVVNRGRLRMALFIGALLALGVSIAHAYFNVETPSNRINWAGGLVMLSFAQIALLTRSVRSRDVVLTVVTLFLYFLSVLLTGARGAYLAIPWLALSAVWALMLAGRRPVLQKLRLASRIAVPLVALSVASLVLLPKDMNVPAQRLHAALEEVQATVFSGDVRHVVNSPVFVRIRFWQHSWDAIRQQPWQGYGRERRMAMIQEWADMDGSQEMHRHIHVHNEYLNGWLDHGVVGLASTLCFMAGFFVVAFLAGRINGHAGIAILGIGVLHVLMSTTDTNTGTNNYGVMMSLSMAIVLLALRPHPDDEVAA
ncbi:MAG: O-antigen ligase family protein [Burkholderiaceae bacterium]